MTQPINPNTNIPMSLRVEKIQHMKQLQLGQQQSFINQQMETENKLKQQRVNENNQTEQAIIGDGQQQHTSEEKKDKQKSNTDEKKEQKVQKMKGDKGSIVDVKI